MTDADVKQIQFRKIHKDDADKVLAADAARSTTHIEDPDFGEVEVQESWALTREVLYDMVSQRRDPYLCTYDSRVMVIEIRSEGHDKRTGKIVPYTRFCGAFIYEKHPTGFEVIYLNVDPRVGAKLEKEVYEQVIAYFKGEANKSSKRKSVSFTILDRDEVGLRIILPTLKALGFAIKLKPNYYNSIDGWECTWKSKTRISEDDEEVAV